jgi:hypothetical protein
MNTKDRNLAIAATMIFAWHANALAAGQAGSPAAAQTAVAQVVSVDAGRLSVIATDHALKAVSEEIAARTGIAIWIDDALEDERVTLAVTKVTVENGLRRLFRGVDAFYFYGSTASEQPKLRAIWVYAKGGGVGLAPVAPERWASTKELESLLSASEPDVRANAVETLLERRGSAGVDIALAALDDESELVRLRVFEALDENGHAVPGAKLVALALSDPSAAVRLRALQAAEDRPEARDIAQGAQYDSDEHVRQEARRVLSRRQ